MGQTKNEENNFNKFNNDGYKAKTMTFFKLFASEQIEK